MISLNSSKIKKLSNISFNSSSDIFSPNSLDIFFNELKVIVSAFGSSMNKSKILLIPSFDSLSPNLSMIESTKSSKEPHFFHLLECLNQQ